MKRAKSAPPISAAMRALLVHVRRERGMRAVPVKSVLATDPSGRLVRLTRIEGLGTFLEEGESKLVLMDRHRHKPGFTAAAPDSDSGLIRPPGWKARHVLRRIYSKRTAERIFDQVLADMQREWMEAMVAGDDRHARWIRIRGYAALLLGAVAHLVASVCATARDIRRVI